MAYKVVKFGGSNLKDREGIKNVLKAVENYHQPLIIVVSAFYGITDRFIDAVNSSANGSFDIEGFIRDISLQKTDTILAAVKDQALIGDFNDELRQRLKKVEDYLLGIRYIRDIPPFLFDEIVSYGERLSSLVLSYILREAGIECREVLPEDIGLLTDGEPLNASVELDQSAGVIRRNLSESKTYIIPGYYGVSPAGKITLLGRGGSDYSAAAIAACVNADSLDLWKDVRGFLSADPKIVGKAAISIDSLTYEEAGELAYFGSKILHPRTTEPLISRNIPIRIMNINDSVRGVVPLTIIHHKATVTKSVIKSVSYNDHFGILKLLGSSVGIIPGILAKSSTELDKAGMNIQSVITSQTAINILLLKDDLHKAKRIIEQRNIHGINEILIDSDISLIAAVGEGITSRHGIAGRIFSAVAKAGINIKIISFGASSVAMYFIVDQNVRDETIRVIHHEFFTGELSQGSN